MKIKNFKELARTDLRKKTLEIIEAGFEEIDTASTVKRLVRFDKKRNQITFQGKTFSLEKMKRVFVVGIGKCSLEAVSVLEKILGKRIDGGIVLDVRKASLKRVKALAGDHPFPSEKNIRKTRRIIDFLKKTEKDDLVIFVISGGGSTLICQPEGFKREEEIVIVKELFRKGATIQEINTIRKHISSARGGYLAYYAYPSSVVSLIFSDVPGDDIQFVASGPTVLDQTSVKDAERVLNKYNIAFDRANIIETPKEKKYFRKVRNFLVISNAIALEAMRKKAKELGLSPVIKTIRLEGEARKIGKKAVKELRRSRGKRAFLYGGETTVTIRGKGKGGRNQELALSALRSIGDNEIVASVASDGWDNTDFAGAVVDRLTALKAKEMGLLPDDFLKNNDSYNFFKKVGDFIETGHTGSNVADFVLAVRE